MTFLSVVIPVYNSEDTISPLADKLVAELGCDYKLEIVLVNDGSRDRSDEVCTALAKKHAGIVRYFSLSRNFGEHNAVMAGFNQARGDYAVVMDDDFQNPVGEVKAMVEEARRGNFDVVYSRYERKKHAWWRNLGSLFNDWVANFMLKKPRGLYLSSFKVLNRFIIKEIIRYDLPFPYVDGLILRVTDRIGQVTVRHEARDKGRSGYTLRKLISLWLNMFTNFSIMPLRISIVVGLSFAAVGAFLALITLLEKLANPTLPVGYAALFAAVSVFSGVMLMALGMTGEYVGRIFLSQNKKPQYVIRKSVE